MRGAILLCGVMGLVSCARHFEVQIQRPPEVDISDVRHLIIGELRGEGSKDIQRDLNAALRSSKASLLFPEMVRAALEQRGFFEDVSIDQSLLPLLEQTYEGSALLVGQVNKYRAHEEIKTRQELDYDEFGILRTYYLSKRRAWVEVEATFQLIDCQSGRVVAIRVAKSKVEASTDETRYLLSEISSPPTPPRIDERVLFAKARQQVAELAVHAIAPHAQTERVTLYTHPSIPELAEGVALAKSGQWRESVGLFLLASKENPENHKVFYNLGVAHKYSERPKQAAAAFQRANELKPSKLYEREIAACKQLIFDRAD